MADEKPVRHIVEHIHQLGDGHRDRHAHNIAGHTAPAEILLAVHRPPPFSNDVESISRRHENVQKPAEKR